MKTYFNTIILFFGFNLMLNAQNIQKDTLCFLLDKKYIVNFDTNPNEFYIKDSKGGNNETLMFIKKEKINKINVQKIQSLKKFIRSSGFYHKKLKLNDTKAAAFLGNYIVIFAKKNNSLYEYFIVSPAIVIP